MKEFKSELLLPVGNMDMCLAAIHHGADAIYLGVPEFNARGRSEDYSIEKLKEVIDLCHLYGVKVYLAFNILVFEEELQNAFELTKTLIGLGPDAFIVQDIGLIKLIRSISKEMRIHASTQMTITNHESLKLLEDLKIQRVVLGREVSLAEMKLIKSQTDLELEVFVHGALCVAYSGQCFTSESIGGRSANRGQCAQSCRFEYQMLVDGEKKQLIDKKYLVSPKDLCGIGEIEELINIGIHSFKIEGRLKSKEYVATSASAYREAIDQVILKNSSNNILKAKKNAMEVAYSRGFFSGWLHGVDHQNLVDGTFSSHRGLKIGQVEKILNKSFIVKFLSSSLDINLKSGDGLLIAHHTYSRDQELGGKIYEIKPLENNRFEIFFSKDFPLKKILNNSFVYKNHDHGIKELVEKTMFDRKFKKRIPLNIKCLFNLNSPLELEVSDGINQLIIKSEDMVTESTGLPLSKKFIVDEFSKLSETAYKLEEFKFSHYTEGFFPQKKLKELRKKIVEDLNKLRTETKHLDIINTQLESHSSNGKKTEKANLNVLIRNEKQVDAIVSLKNSFDFPLGIIILDFEFGKDYLRSIEKLKANNFVTAIATTRILKPNEYHNFTLIERSNPDYVLVRNLGALYYFKQKNYPMIGDFSLNVSNSESFKYLIQKGLESISLSYDLNINRLKKLLGHIDGDKAEVTIHQYMPSFHMEHCVFAAFLSKGKSFRDCGKPCEKHSVELIDQFSNRHKIKADQECRNTMYNAKAMSGALHIESILDLGLKNFRIEFLFEDEEQIYKKILAYGSMIFHKHDFDSAFESLKIEESFGVSDVYLKRSGDYHDKKKKAKYS